MAGDLPADKMKELLTQKYRQEYFHDAKVFTYNVEREEVEYMTSYDCIPQERFEPGNAGKCDATLL